MARKTLGRTPGSLNAPIAAFTMAVVLCSYCISSINTARREAATSAANPLPPRQKPADKVEAQSSWIQQALESQEAEHKKGGK